MTITLTKDGTSLELPEDLLWTDEFLWAAVAQSTQRGIDGHLIVDAMERMGGRPITLMGDGDSAWITRADMLTLKAWAAIAGQQFELDVRGDVWTVIFDHGDAEDARSMGLAPVVDYSDMQDGDYYCSLVLRFIEI